MSDDDDGDDSGPDVLSQALRLAVDHAQKLDYSGVSGARRGDWIQRNDSIRIALTGMKRPHKPENADGKKKQKVDRHTARKRGRDTVAACLPSGPESQDGELHDTQDTGHRLGVGSSTPADADAMSQTGTPSWTPEDLVHEALAGFDAIKKKSAMANRKVAVERAVEHGMPVASTEEWARALDVGCGHSHVGSGDEGDTLQRLIGVLDYESVEDRVRARAPLLASQTHSAMRSRFLALILGKVECLWIESDMQEYFDGATTADANLVDVCSRYQLLAYVASHGGNDEDLTADEETDLRASSEYKQWAKEERRNTVGRQQLWEAFGTYGPVVLADPRWITSQLTSGANAEPGWFTRGAGKAFVARDPSRFRSAASQFHSLTALLEALLGETGRECGERLFNDYGHATYVAPHEPSSETGHAEEGDAA